MSIQVLTEPTATGYRAISSAPFAMEVEASTREDARDQLRQLIASRMSTGAELESIDVPMTSHPLSEFVGDLKDDALLPAYLNEIENFRRIDTRQPFCT